MSLNGMRIALTSSLTRRQVGSDLRIGHSTLGKWVRVFSEEAKVPAQDAELLHENERRRKENHILREEREVLKKAAMRWPAAYACMRERSLRNSKAVKFQYIAVYSSSLTRSHLCRLMGVTERGLHAWKHRPPSHRQRRDILLLAQIRDQHRLSLGRYGRLRMKEESNELGLQVGQRRAGRLMRHNTIQVVRPRKFKTTTNRDRTVNIAPHLLQQDFAASAPNHMA